MEERKIYLANGDALIRTEDGNYLISENDSDLHRGIDKEEGERLLFETVEQLKMSLEAWVENSRDWQTITEKYAIALEKIAEYEHGDLEQTEIAKKALEDEEEEE